MTVLRFPAGSAVGMLWWEGASGERPAIGTVEVPDGTAVHLESGAIVAAPS